MSLAYSLGRALRALTGRSRHHSSAPPARGSANATPPSWRAAGEESDGLHIAVTAMASHTGVLQQIANSWLMWANLWTRDPAQFRANVAYAQSIALRLEHEAHDVVATVRRLEALRNGVAVFDQRRAQAERLTDAAGLLSMALHARLHELANEQDVQASALTAVAHRTQPVPDAAWIQQHAAAMTDARPLTLQEVVA